MANRLPLVADSANLRIKELAAGDNLDLAGSNLVANTVTANSLVTSSGMLAADSPISETFSVVTSSSNTVTLDVSSSSNFLHTLTENTNFVFSNPAANNVATAITLKLVQDGSASGYTVAWPASVDWASATAPTLTATASAVDIFVFYSHDNGNNWYGFTSGQAMG